MHATGLRRGSWRNDTSSRELRISARSSFFLRCTTQPKLIGPSSPFAQRSMPLTEGFRLFKPELSRNPGFLVGSSVAATLVVVAIARLISRTSPKKILSSRATQLLHLSKAEQSELPYPPDVFPGARDVDSPVSRTMCQFPFPKRHTRLIRSQVWHDKGLRMGARAW